MALPMTSSFKSPGAKSLGLWDIAEMLRKVYESNAPMQNFVLWCDAITMLIALQFQYIMIYLL